MIKFTSASLDLPCICARIYKATAFIAFFQISGDLNGLWSQEEFWVIPKILVGLVLNWQWRAGCAEVQAWKAAQQIRLSARCQQGRWLR